MDVEQSDESTTKFQGTQYVEFNTPGPHVFTVPQGITTIWIYACGGGDGGQTGQTSPGSQLPGWGGKGGDGRMFYPQPHDNTGHAVGIGVNAGDTININVGYGGGPDRSGIPSIVSKQFGFNYVFGVDSRYYTRGAGGVQTGLGDSGDGQGYSIVGADPSYSKVSGGKGGRSHYGNDAHNWGGFGGGGGAGRLAGGDGGCGGCDYGLATAYPPLTVGDPGYQALHRGQHGQGAQANLGAGGGGGGGGGDVDGQGGPGGPGGSGSVVIAW